jgi:hypothetical protein
MDQALANALKRRLELEKELNKLNQFIHMYHELAGTKGEDGDTPHLFEIQPGMLVESPAGAGFQGVVRSGGWIKPRGRPADFAQIMATVLKDVGYPLQRGQLVEEIEKRGHSIPSSDKPRYLGTILWRNGQTFESIDGRGYWLKGVRVPEPELEELERNFGTPDP